MSDFLFVTVNLSQFLVHINAKKKLGGGCVVLVRVGLSSAVSTVIGLIVRCFCVKFISAEFYVGPRQWQQETCE